MIPGPKTLTTPWQPIKRCICGLIALLLVIAPTAHAQDLLSAYRAALAHDPTFLAAEANWRAEQQLRKQARAAYWPQVEASANGYRNQSDSTLSPPPSKKEYDSDGYSITLSQTLFNWARGAATKQASATLRRAAAVYTSARQALILRVSERYFAVLLAKDNLRLAQSERKAIARQRDVARARLRVGLGTITEVHDAEARYQLAVVQELEAQNKLLDAQEGLIELTAAASTAPKPLRDKFPLRRPDPTDPATWTARALSHNPELMAAAAEVEIARAVLKDRRAGHWPRLDLIARHSNSNSTQISTGTPYTSQANAVGIELTIPIYQGGRVLAAGREARHRLQAARHTLDARRRATRRAVRDAYLTVSSGTQRVEALNLAVVASESALTAKRTGFRAGINTNIDVLDAQRDLYRTRRDYAEARYAYLLSVLGLKLAAGDLNEKDLQQINGWLQ